jgi:phage tail-like protein
MTAPAPAQPAVESRYLDHLPAIFRAPQQEGTPNFLGQFLRAFEEVLTGTGQAADPGLAEIISGIAPDANGNSPLSGLSRYVEPGHGLTDRDRAPSEFLDWLAGWVALSLRADLEENTQREFIANAASLYRSRGTPKGLADLLTIYTQLGVTIDEGAGFRIRDQVETAILGTDTVLGGFVPHYFEVTLRHRSIPKQFAEHLAKASLPHEQLAPSLPEELARYLTIATEIIEAEKPAHCYYGLSIISVSLQINVTSRVGVDTLLASAHA